MDAINLGCTYDGRLLKVPGKCALCECEVPELVQDHNHETGEMRSMLCRGCNLQVGLIEKGRVDSVNSWARPFMKSYIAMWDKN